MFVLVSIPGVDSGSAEETEGLIKLCPVYPSVVVRTGLFSSAVKRAAPADAISMAAAAVLPVLVGEVGVLEPGARVGL